MGVGVGVSSVNLRWKQPGVTDEADYQRLTMTGSLEEARVI